MSSGSRPISLRDEARGHIEFVLGTAAGSLWGGLSEREFWPYRCLKILKIKRCRGEFSDNSRRCFAENAPPKSQNQDLTSYKFCGRPRKAKAGNLFVQLKQTSFRPRCEITSAAASNKIKISIYNHRYHQFHKLQVSIFVTGITAVNFMCPTFLLLLSVKELQLS